MAETPQTPLQNSRWTSLSKTSRSSLYELPAELVHLIIHELNAPTNLASFRLTCRRFFGFSEPNIPGGSHWLPYSQHKTEDLTHDDWTCVSRFADSQTIHTWQDSSSAEAPLVHATYEACVPMMEMIISSVNLNSWQEQSLGRLFSILLDTAFIRGDVVIIQKVVEMLEELMNHNWAAKRFNAEAVAELVIRKRIIHRRVLLASLLLHDHVEDLLVCMANISILPSLRKDACCIAACSPAPGLLRQVVNRISKSVSSSEAETFMEDICTSWNLSTIDDCLGKQLNICRHLRRPSRIPRLTYWEYEVIKIPLDLLDKLRDLQISLHHGDNVQFCDSPNTKSATLDHCRHPNLVDFVKMWTLEDKVHYINGVLSDSPYHPRIFHDMDVMKVLLDGDAHQLNLSGLHAAFTRLKQWDVVGMIKMHMKGRQVRDIQQSPRRSSRFFDTAENFDALPRLRRQECKRSTGNRTHQLPKYL